MRLWTDSGYRRHPQLFKRGDVEHGLALLNHFGGKLRMPNEWTFGVVHAQFPGIEKFDRPHLQPAGVVWSVAALFTNCHNCLYGGNTSMFFDLSPPQLEDYLDGE
jgi:hypothetical protein